MTSLMLLLLVSLSPLTSAEILIEPYMLAVEVGDTISISCSTDAKGDAELQWSIRRDKDAGSSIIIYPANATVTPQPTAIPSAEVDDFLARATSDKGELTILNATMSDNGILSCLDTKDNSTMTARLNIYVMPDYVTEGIVFISLSAVSFVLVVIFGIVTMIRERKRFKVRKGQDRKPIIGRVL